MPCIIWKEKKHAVQLHAAARDTGGEVVLFVGHCPLSDNFVRVDRSQRFVTGAHRRGFAASVDFWSRAWEMEDAGSE